jgi:hypothetical protein
LTPVDWLWIPVTVWAALAQTLRNAAQRHLTAELGTLGDNHASVVLPADLTRVNDLLASISIAGPEAELARTAVPAPPPLAVPQMAHVRMPDPSKS